MPRFERLALISLPALMLGLSAPQVRADTITITDLDWDAARVISRVLAEVIHQEFGVPVAIKPGTTEESLQSMDLGNGVHDIFPDIWMPNRQDAWVKYVEETKTIGHNGGYEAIQAFFIPENTADKLGIRSIEDLKDAGIAARFDSDGDGLGEYWPGEAGWGATRLNRIKFRSYGLDEYWEAMPSTNAEFKSRLETAIADNRPILFYHWTPEWVFAAYDLRQIEEPAYFDGCDRVFTPEEREDWLEVSSFPCAFENSHVYIFYSASLETRHPDVAALLRHIEFDPQVINEWVGETGLRGTPPGKVAADWVSQNPETVEEWLVRSRNP